MKLQKLTLTVLILTVLFANGMLCKDSKEEKQLRRNERRAGKRLREHDRPRRLRNQRSRGMKGAINPELVDTAPVLHRSGPERPEQVLREATRLERQRAHSRLQNKQTRRQNDFLTSSLEMTTTTTSSSTEESATTTTTATFESEYYDANNSNVTWSGDHDLMSINGTFNDTYLFEEFNSTLYNETFGNETHPNVTSTPKPPKTTPDPRTLNIFRIKQRNRMMRIIMIQTQILDKLGFTKQPNVNASVTLTEEDREAYKKLLPEMENDNEDKRYLWDLPSCDVPRKSDPGAWIADGDVIRLYFDIKLNRRLDEETRVPSAILSLYKKSFTDEAEEVESEIDEDEDDEDGDDEDDSGKIRLTLYQYVKAVKKKRKEKKVEIQSILVSKKQEGWVKFHIGQAVESWLKNPMKNFGLVLVAEDMQHRILNANMLFETFNCSNNNSHIHFPIPISLALPGSSISERNRTTQHLHANQTFPYLQVIAKYVTIEENNSRFKRELSKRRTKGCARQDMYVSFAELGWSDWIIQPKGFDAGYCKGTCSSVADDPSGSLKIKHFTAKLPDGVEFTQFECCGPSKLKPLQILHFDQNGKMAVSVFDDFLITQCGCRP